MTSAITPDVKTWSSVQVRVRMHRPHTATRWPRKPAHAPSRAKVIAMFSGWKKSRAASGIAAQNGIGDARATARHADAARWAGRTAQEESSAAACGHDM